jgi:hypothetical protein
MERAVLDGDNRGQSYGQFIDEGARLEQNLAVLCKDQVEGKAIKGMTNIVRIHIAGIIVYFFL